MTSLVVFGDSWPAGAGLLDRTLAFPCRLAEIKGVQGINLGADGTSIDHASLALMEFVKHTKHITHRYSALFCITDPSRSIGFTEQGRAIEFSVSDVSEPAATFYRCIHNQHWEEFQLRRNLLMMESLCFANDIQPFFVANWTQPYDLAKYVKNVYHKSLAEILGYTSRAEFAMPNQKDWPNEVRQREGRYMYPSVCHPNVHGHELIARELGEWIN